MFTLVLPQVHTYYAVKQTGHKLVSLYFQQAVRYRVPPYTWLTVCGGLLVPHRGCGDGSGLLLPY